MEESLITHIRSENNHADLMTKVTSGCKRRRLVGNNLYDNFGTNFFGPEQVKKVSMPTVR